MCYDTYKNALTEWKLDGFELDFIDCFVNRDNVPYNDKMDCESVQEGVDRLLRDIKQTLTEINPDIMIDCLNEVSGYAKSKGVYANVHHYYSISEIANEIIMGNRI